MPDGQMATAPAREFDALERRALRLLLAEPGLDRADLARRMRVAPPVVARMADACLADGVLLDAGAGLALNPDYAFSFGLELLEDVLSLVLMDFSGSERAVRSMSTRRLSREQAVRQLLRSRDDILDEVAGARHIVGAGAGVGSFLADGGFMKTPHPSREWPLAEIRAMLEQALGMPVEVERGAAAAAAGENLFGIGRRFRDFVYLYLENGLGAGIIHAGRPLRGHRRNEGSLAGVEAMLDEPLPRLDDLRAALALLGTTFDDLATMCASITVDTPGVAAWLDKAARPLATLTRILGSVLDPELIVLGSRLPVAVTQALVDRVRGGQAAQAGLALSPRRRHPVAAGAAALPLFHRFFA